jgi:hypothetical protein
LTLILAGVLVFGVGASAIGFALVGVGVVVFILNVVVRLGFSSHDDRDREERARQTFTRSGRWPSR